MKGFGRDLGKGFPQEVRGVDFLSVGVGEMHKENGHCEDYVQKSEDKLEIWEIVHCYVERCRGKWNLNQDENYVGNSDAR